MTIERPAPRLPVDLKTRTTSLKGVLHRVLRRVLIGLAMVAADGRALWTLVTPDVFLRKDDS